MGDYGYKILNYEAGSVYAVMCGVRSNYDTTPAMLTNSLFLDFLETHGLQTQHNERTRDVICLQFNYGSRSYREEVARIQQTLDRLRGEEEPPEEKIAYMEELLAAADANYDKFDKKNAEAIREIFYRDGLEIRYRDETLHYKMLYRTPGKAKKGSCMFIRDELFAVAQDFLRMGITLPDNNAPIVEVGAYSSLITSTIVGRIQINPHDILVLEDVESNFSTTAISIEIDEQKHCHAVRRENYGVSNVLFDGQALIDYSAFPDWGDGYVLLRQHFMKAAAFATDIQGFFRDYFGAGYNTAIVKDMWGNEHLAKNVRVITTNNAMKWMKFGISYEYWCAKVLENGGLFGVVKTAHPSKLGNVQRMSYQMVNALDGRTMDRVMERSLEYIDLLKTDTSVFLDYLRKNANFSNDFEALVALWEQDHDFERCDYFRLRKQFIIASYIKHMKCGKLIQDADNLVMVGSPYAMLLHSVGEPPEDDPTFTIENGCIQCYTERFDAGEYLAGFRSPYNSQNNMLYLHNTKHPLLQKYFNLGKLILAVNTIHTDIEDRANGCDFDSDMAYVTNQPDIVMHASNCYRDYPTIVNNIPKESNHYNNTPEDFAAVDNKLARSQRAIGESSNLAQLALTYDATFGGAKFKDYVCILSVLAQCAIDNAKRTFDIDITEEIKRMKDGMDVKNNGYPAFWLVIRPGFNHDKVNPRLVCPMNHLYKVKTKEHKPPTSTLPISEFFVHHKLEINRKISKNVEKLIRDFSLNIYNYNLDDENNSEQYFLLREDFEELVEQIRRTTLPDKYIGLMAWLINRAFVITPGVKRNTDIMNTTMNKNKSLLLKTLFDVNRSSFLACFTGHMNKLK